MDEETTQEPRRRKDNLYIDVYPESWYAVAPSKSLPKGKVEPLEAFSKKWVLYRTKSGEVHITGRYCPHFGASFQTGTVKGERLVCRFHGWEYESGKCVRIPYMEGGKIPPAACVTSLPVIEKLGWIWVWNGRAPTFDLPDLPESRDPAYGHLEKSVWLDAHPLTILENGTDAQHFRYVHRSNFSSYDVKVLRDEPHHFEFVLSQNIPTPFGGSFTIDARVHYIGGTIIYGGVGTKGKQHSAFIASPLPVSYRKTHFHQMVYPKRLPTLLLRPISRFYERWLGNKIITGTTDDYEPVWRYQDSDFGGALVAEDALSQRYHRLWRNHLPKEVQSRITLSRKAEVD